jgi:hypothetical protein
MVFYKIFLTILLSIREKFVKKFRRFIKVDFGLIKDVIKVDVLSL